MLRVNNISTVNILLVYHAFASVARECLMRKMRNMGLDENLVGWTSNFMTERAKMVVDG